MSKVKPHINPAILTWARQRLNFTPEDLAKKAGVSEERYVEWEKGEARPTFRQLSLIAKGLGRTSSFFYLQQPPDEPEPRLEMRRVYGSNPVQDSKEFAKEIQEMLKRRAIAIQLFERLEEEVPEIPFRFELETNPEESAQIVREWLGISMDTQLGWDNVYAALKGWRKVLESKGILTFQMSGIPVAEARGFAINYRPFPIAAFNSNDAVTGRIFTLLHEVGHILLGESVLHERSPLESNNAIENWCNRFSATVLLPEEYVTQTARDTGKHANAVWSEQEIEAISRRFIVSPSAMVRRLRRLDLIANESYQELVKVFDQRRPYDSGGSGGNHYNNVLARLGTLLPSMAFQGYYSGEINTRDLSSIMGTSVAKLGVMEEKVMGVNYAFK